MTHAYAKEIHQFIAEQISASKSALQRADAAHDQQKKHFQEGKLKEYQALRKLMTGSYDLSTQKYF